MIWTGAAETLVQGNSQASLQDTALGQSAASLQPGSPGLHGSPSSPVLPGSPRQLGHGGGRPAEEHAGILQRQGCSLSL